MSDDPIERGYLLAAHRDRIRTRLTDALDMLAHHWTGAMHPPAGQHSGRRTQPASRPPTPIGPTSVRDAAWRDLRSWCQLVMDERDLHTAPQAQTGAGLARWLTTHADWLAAHEAGKDCADEMARHARLIRDLDRGYHARRFQLGPCVEDVHDEAGVETYRCTGSLWALMRQEDDLLPDKVACDAVEEHVWRPGEWARLGVRMGMVHPAGVDRLVARLAGYTSG